MFISKLKILLLFYILQILYISIHRYDHGKFFPNSKDADFPSVGKGRGEGFNVNIPWNEVFKKNRFMLQRYLVLN